MGTPPSVTGTPSPPPVPLDHIRWLHDIYERRAEHEDNLIDRRATFFVALTSALIAAEALAFVHPGTSSDTAFPIVTEWLAPVAVITSFLWGLVLHRTTTAQHIWRYAQMALEESTPALFVDIVRPWPRSQSNFTPAAPNLGLPAQLHGWVMGQRARHHLLDSTSPNAIWITVPFVALFLWFFLLVLEQDWFIVTALAPSLVALTLWLWVRAIP